MTNITSETTDGLDPTMKLNEDDLKQKNDCHYKQARWSKFSTDSVEKEFQDATYQAEKSSSMD